MTRKNSASKRESLFLWSSSGIRRIRKRIRDAFPSRASGNAASLFSFLEHRRYPRLDLQFPILYKVLGEYGQGIPAEVRPYLLAQSMNVSPLGLCMNLGERFQPGTILALTLHIVDRREKFHAVGRVTWTKPAAEPAHFLTGIQFVIVEGETVKRQEHSKITDLIGQRETG